MAEVPENINPDVLEEIANVRRELRSGDVLPETWELAHWANALNTLTGHAAEASGMAHFAAKSDNEVDLMVHAKKFHDAVIRTAAVCFDVIEAITGREDPTKTPEEAEADGPVE